MELKITNKVLVAGILSIAVLILLTIPAISFAQTDTGVVDPASIVEGETPVTNVDVSVTGSNSETDDNESTTEDNDTDDVGVDDSDSTTDDADKPTTRDRIQKNLRSRVDSVRSLFQQKRDVDDSNVDKPERADQTEKKAELAEKREEKKAQLAEKAKERIRAYGERILKRFEAALDRLDNLADRIDSRIEKMEEKGLDLSDAQSLVDTARVSLTEARTSLDLAIAEIENVLEAEDRKDAFAGTKTLLANTKEAVKAAHASLVEAIKAIRATGGVSKDSTEE